MRKRFRPGIGFADFVVQDSATRKSRISDEPAVDYRKGWLVWMGVIVLFGGLLFRLASLQLFYGNRYRVLSDQNRVKRIKLPAPRGIIYDRNGLKLADNIKMTVEVKNGDTTDVVERWRRIYPSGEAAAHVAGYLGEVKETEVGLLKTAGGKYDAGDLMGRSGLEAQFEEYLRGEDGGRLVEVDHMGKIVRELGRREPVSGHDVRTTIDVRLQETALAALDGKKGAVVVSNPHTGEVLAMVSSPSFDGNIFNGGKGNEKKVIEALTDTNLPLFNRAIGAVYPPGSTYKMVTTAAAITEGKVPADFVYQDTGVITVGSFSYSNWLFTKRGATEGTVGFVKALSRSTDTFFYKVGEMTTPEVLAAWSHTLGLGEPTGIELPGEVAGLIPTPDWKQKTKGEQWYLGNTFHMAIGQGDVLTTPAQVNVMTGVWATGGKRCNLTLVMGKEAKCTEVSVSPAAMKLVKQGMEGACADGGTAFPLFGFTPHVACKTGTAEYMTDSGKMRTHGWLTAYAPADNPALTVTVVVEGGGEGSNVAAPVVRKVLAKYFNVEDTYNYAAIPQEVSE